MYMLVMPANHLSNHLFFLFVHFWTVVKDKARNIHSICIPTFVRIRKASVPRNIVFLSLKLNGAIFLYAFFLFAAEELGIKSVVPAYLDPNLKTEDLLTGVSFASGGSGYDPLTPKLVVILYIIRNQTII